MFLLIMVIRGRTWALAGPGMFFLATWGMCLLQRMWRSSSEDPQAQVFFSISNSSRFSWAWCMCWNSFQMHKSLQKWPFFNQVQLQQVSGGKKKGKVQKFGLISPNWRGQPRVMPWALFQWRFSRSVVHKLHPFLQVSSIYHVQLFDSEQFVVFSMKAFKAHLVIFWVYNTRGFTVHPKP